MVLLYWPLFHPGYTSRPLEAPPVPGKKILLVPLDSRPPCRQFVLDAGRIADYAVTAPPSSIQDYYSLPGDTSAMKAWIRENIRDSCALILSVDQLLYGGLIAARESTASPEEVAALLEFLQRLHADFPQVPIYAFSILPRLSPQDTIDGYDERRWLTEYSRLAGRKAAGHSVDEERLAFLRERIPSESLEKYLSHFRENTSLNRSLIELAQKGVLSRLILGQDDGEAYSIPNIEKEKLRKFLEERGIPEELVFLAHGADEIALTLLAEIHGREMGFRPRVFLDYGEVGSEGLTMPFMAIPTGICAEEKLRMLGAISVASPEDADFILFLSANDKEEGGLSARTSSLLRLQHFREKGYPIALVDLSKHFQMEEILLPHLLRRDFPVNSLIAYAGWNTASNSIGTALAQACLFTGQKRELREREDAIRLYGENLRFLQNRILEDAFYLKDVITLVNTALIKEGYINTADLDLEHNARWANAMLQYAMGQRIAAYRETTAFRRPFSADFPEGKKTLRLGALSADMSYPWPRTFEIHLESAIRLEEVP